MTILVNNEEYLSTQEAMVALETTPATFQAIRKHYNLKAIRRLGRRGKYYRKADIEAIPRYIEEDKKEE